MKTAPQSQVRRLALTGALVLTSLGASAFTLTEIGEWVVSCDNAATCSLVNASQLAQKRVSQPSPFGMSRICIHRRGGVKDGAEIFVTLAGHMPKNFAKQQEERYFRVVGGKKALPNVALRFLGTEHWEVPADQASQLLATTDDNAQLHVVARDGVVIERLSVHGIDKALSTIDQAQHRAGTATALRKFDGMLVLPGSTPARSEPPALVTAPLTKLAPAPSPSSEAVRLQQHACGAPGLDRTIGYRLLGDQQRADRILWVTPCDPKPGLRRDFFVIENADGTALPVEFPGTSPGRPTGQPGLLSTPHLDTERGLVREQWIAPVPPAADEACAINRVWGWNGRTFELAEERRSLSCAGIVSGYWAKTYTRSLITPAPEGMAANAAPFQPPC